MAKFLDESGLSYFYGKLKSKFSNYVYVGTNPPADLPVNAIWIDPAETGTFVDASDFLTYNTPGAGFHNCIFRGKFLGTSVSAAQSAAIKAGTFDDIYIGDYWTIDGKDWIVVALDYYYNCGDTACTTHHCVVIPSTPLYNHVMNDANVTTGAYMGSKMYKSGLDAAKTTITNAFGADHLLTIRQYFANATNETYGFETNGAWVDATVWLMNERNVYGATAYRNNYKGGQSWVMEYTIDTSQYPYFTYLKNKINPSRWWYWLRDSVSTDYFAHVYYYGNCSYYNASYSGGVRPAFLVI